MYELPENTTVTDLLTRLVRGFSHDSDILAELNEACAFIPERRTY
jgi:hypothetical protein